MRMIDADELLNEVRNNKELYERERVYLEGLLLNAPTVEPEPFAEWVTKWIMITEFDGFIHSKCSCCNQFNDWGDVPFCPWCRADMRGKEK